MALVVRDSVCAAGCEIGGAAVSCAIAVVHSARNRSPVIVFISAIQSRSLAGAKLVQLRFSEMVETECYVENAWMGRN